MKPVVVCVSGKRKAGKDFICNLLASRLKAYGCEVVVRGVSHSLKEQYALINGLDPERLKSSEEYKEKYRRDMVEWGETIRKNDPFYFCRFASCLWDVIFC